jgi:hypothetical protein
VECGTVFGFAAQQLKERRGNGMLSTRELSAEAFDKSFLDIKAL